MRFLALVRGINRGSEGKVPMGELAKCFEDCGLDDVATYANSGNVIFTSARTSAKRLAADAESAMERRLGIEARVLVMSAADLLDAVGSAPDWWGVTGDWRHDAVFVIPPASAHDVLTAAGDTDPAFERAIARGQVVFWSVHTLSYGRSRLSRLADHEVYKSVTLRSSTTVRRLAERLG